jgi:hypothetical protein
MNLKKEEGVVEPEILNVENKIDVQKVMTHV